MHQPDQKRSRAIGKLFGRKGWFYHVAGYRAAGVDGPCDFTIPPYNEYVVLAPLAPKQTAKDIAKTLDGVTVLVTDINDLGCTILGSSQKVDLVILGELLRQNPLGQGDESTPMGLLTQMKREV